MHCSAIHLLTLIWCAAWSWRDPFWGSFRHYAAPHTVVIQDMYTIGFARLGRKIYLAYRRHYVLLPTLTLCVWCVLNIFIGLCSGGKLPLEQYCKLRPTKVSPHNFNYILRPANACGNNKNPFLLITIVSLHQNKEFRNNIRQTWGSVAKTRKWPQGGKADLTINERITVLFLFGVHRNDSLNKLLIEESREYGDILQQDFIESYQNLTLKVLMGFKWMSKYCGESRFIMKADEDTFVNIPMLIDHLVSRNWSNRIYGFTYHEQTVRRYSRVKVSRQAFPNIFYPPYCTGTMYVMHAALAKSLFYASEFMPYINVEDAHITGILAYIFNVTHVTIPHSLYDSNYPPHECDFALNRKLYAQQVFTEKSRIIWSHIRHPSKCHNMSIPSDYSRTFYNTLKAIISVVWNGPLHRAFLTLYLFCDNMCLPFFNS